MTPLQMFTILNSSQKLEIIKKEILLLREELIKLEIRIVEANLDAAIKSITIATKNNVNFFSELPVIKSTLSTYYFELKRLISAKRKEIYFIFWTEDKNVLDANLRVTVARNALSSAIFLHQCYSIDGEDGWFSEVMNSSDIYIEAKYEALRCWKKSLHTYSESVGQTSSDFLNSVRDISKNVLMDDNIYNFLMSPDTFVLKDEYLSTPSWYGGEDQGFWYESLGDFSQKIDNLEKQEKKEAMMLLQELNNKP